MKCRTLAFVLFITLSACAQPGSVRPAKAIFSIDESFQLRHFDKDIEQLFESTRNVLNDAGYDIVVADRATGHISGRRGAGAGIGSDKSLVVHAFVVPRNGDTELALKIVQVIKSGPLGTRQTELPVSDPVLYGFVFQRIADNTKRPALPDSWPIAPRAAPPSEP